VLLGGRRFSSVAFISVQAGNLVHAVLVDEGVELLGAGVVQEDAKRVRVVVEARRED